MARGDVVVSIGSSLLKTPGDLSTLESKLEVGRPVSVVVTRNGGKLIKILNIEPDAPPGAVAPQAVAKEEEAEPGAKADLDAKAESAPTPVAEAAPEAVAVKIAPEVVAEKAAEPPVQGSAETPVPGQEMKAETAPKEDAFGVRCQAMNPDLASALGAPDGRGALVVDVKAGSIAAVAGFKAGDIITKVGDQDVADADQLGPAVENRTGLVPIEALRQGTARTVQVQFGGEAPAEAPAKVSGQTAVQDGAADQEIEAMREEIKSLQAEIKKLRAEVEKLRKM
jgi:S1-C subfamily serine protease